MNYAPPKLALCVCALLWGVANPWTVTLSWAQPAPSTRAPDPAIDAARSAFEALPEADRRGIQEGLIWTGDYSGVADGTFGRQTFDAMSTFQKNTGRPSTGILSAADRNTLQANARNDRTAVGFETVIDAKSGVQLGVPLKLLSKSGDNPNGGSRWQSADGKVTLDTRVAPGDATLSSIYDRNLAIKTPGRVVTYKVLRPDFFVIAGETPAGKFYTRYAGAASGIRAFSIGYDKSVAPQFDRLVVAIANSFVPFPTGPGPIVAQPASVPATPSPPTVTGGQAPYGTGLILGKRHVLTAAPLDRCKEIRIRNAKVQQINGKGPFLLEMSQDLEGRPAALSPDTAAVGQRALVFAFGNDGDGEKLLAAAATIEDGQTLTGALQPGASGAPVISEAGALIGLVNAAPSSSRQIAGIVPSARYAVVPANLLTERFPSLASILTKPAAPMESTADIAGIVRSSIVPITCSL
ncbi:serine protease [Microvirga puerhi]|uniref:Peptidoglycan-binding protein n=1 Tax=Microvirga puerhi TaxID=2876078 RepID=A0ABS7VSV8_9HYPH|nr:serine protease [Microvirga puerhi]MBZ6078647.1 peptidoglycan-binding protein [Microvirga puerhi]